MPRGAGAQKKNIQFKKRRRFQESHAFLRLTQRYPTTISFKELLDNLRSGDYNILIKDAQAPLVVIRYRDREVFAFIKHEPSRARPTLQTVLTKEMAGRYLRRQATKELGLDV